MQCDLEAVGTDGAKTIFVCRVCKLERRLTQSDPSKVGATCGTSGPAPKPRAPCIHLGAELRREQCQTCAGNVQVKVMACEVFGECTAGKALPGVQCCGGPCPKYTTSDPTRPPPLRS